MALRQSPAVDWFFYLALLCFLLFVTQPVLLDSEQLNLLKRDAVMFVSSLLPYTLLCLPTETYTIMACLPRRHYGGARRHSLRAFQKARSRPTMLFRKCPMNQNIQGSEYISTSFFCIIVVPHRYFPSWPGIGKAHSQNYFLTAKYSMGMGYLFIKA